MQTHKWVQDFDGAWEKEPLNEKEQAMAAEGWIFSPTICQKIPDFYLTREQAIALARAADTVMDLGE